MYTRSYGNRNGGVRTPLPPDYGGTALVIRQPEKQTDFQVTNRNDNRRESFPEERQRRRYAAGEGETSARKKLEKEDGDEENDGYIFSPPFGGEGLPSEKTVDVFLNDTANEEKKETGLGGFFSPENLKSDDLLLLGLIFLLFGSDEGSREALLILAVLYLSGL